MLHVEWAVTQVHRGSNDFQSEHTHRCTGSGRTMNTFIAENSQHALLGSCQTAEPHDRLITSHCQSVERHIRSIALN